MGSVIITDAYLGKHDTPWCFPDLMTVRRTVLHISIRNIESKVLYLPNSSLCVMRSIGEKGGDDQPTPNHMLSDHEGNNENKNKNINKKVWLPRAQKAS